MNRFTDAVINEQTLLELGFIKNYIYKLTIHEKSFIGYSAGIVFIGTYETTYEGVCLTKIGEDINIVRLDHIITNRQLINLCESLIP